MDSVWQAPTWNPNNFIYWVSAQLQISELTAQNLLEEPASKIIEITHSPETYSMRETIAVCDTSTEIVEYDNFLSHTVFKGKEKFHIFGHGSIVIWSSEPPWEHLEHEWDSPNVNVWYLMTHERVIGLYVSDEDTITSNSFLHMLEIFGLPQLDINNNLTILQVDQVPLRFAHIFHNCLNNEFQSLVMDRKRWRPIVGSHHSLDPKAFCFFLWGCQRPSLQPGYIYTGWT